MIHIAMAVPILVVVAALAFYLVRPSGSFDEESLTALELQEWTYKAGLPRRDPVIQRMIEVMGIDGDPSQVDIYEFGVRYGGGLRRFVELVRESNIPVGHIWGFDSWDGLPASLLVGNYSNGNYDYSEGEMSVIGNRKKQFRNWADASNHIAHFIGDNTTLIKGFFNESLTDVLVDQHGMKPARLVSIDCDLYGSTIQAMEWLLANQILQEGTFVYYDEFDDGEGPAHRDITKKYNLTWEPLLFIPTKDLPIISCCGDVNFLRLVSIGRSH